jgi:hypothetical protein
MRARRAVSVSLCALAVAGCGTGLICTTEGCGSGVSFFLPPVLRAWPKAARVRICVSSNCRSVSPHARVVSFRGSKLSAAAVVKVSVEMLTKTSHVLYQAVEPATVKKLAPNGVKCGPVCYDASAAIDPRTDSLTTNARRIQSLLAKHLIR